MFLLGKAWVSVKGGGHWIGERELESTKRLQEVWIRELEAVLAEVSKAMSVFMPKRPRG